MKRIRVVIAEEQPDARKAQRLLLALEPDVDIIGEVNNGFDALDMAGTLHPDILILGLNASNTLEIVRLINQRFPDIAVAIPHKDNNQVQINEMIRAKVKIYNFRGPSSKSFVDSMQKMNSNRAIFSAPAEKTVAKNVSALMKSAGDLHRNLTKREREVFYLVFGGFTNAMIADRLSISRRTVEGHRANLMRKLGLRGQCRRSRKYIDDRNVVLEANSQDKSILQ